MEEAGKMSSEELREFFCVPETTDAPDSFDFDEDDD